ncbi:ADP-L-glycero-D-manno-heptose-6-epimerase [Vulcanimicrobium alpinum]|uniref:ADP-L-glycero-D-manno-heptose-6-epimerase n=1 Tax=Vulcanimicrobium alpinum TaxID=3016050 RepID=A0AAN1XYE5_UNVUL|nr:ADP-glyceromanno-heptose 6-epimerase [Vulcanimicrobium alpinum]BDE07685.1 ADP-L-glycero-D-manno-heptose-6-epimerase [Vulcanimicrobium alpinum]
MDRVVVTGGAGLIGSALVRHLNLDGIEDIVVVDRLGTSEKWRHLVPLRFADYLDAGEFYARIAADPYAFGRVAAVFHLGACSSTTERDASYLVQNNVRRSQEIARWSFSLGARFTYASSAATYGARECEMREDLDPHALRPLNMYGYSKHLFDRWMRREGLLERAVGLKYFNVYGPNEDHKGEMRSVVAKAYEQIRATGTIELFKSYREGIADGEQSRDFLYVKDAAAITAFLAASPAAGGLYNVGSGIARTWNDLARAVFAALDLPPRIIYVEMPDALRGKYQYRTVATIDRLRDAGWTRPFTTLEAAIDDYVRRYLTSGAALGDESASSPLPTLSATR